ncbi:YppG family protein [Heyndrickxia acidicola]|uniref:YppG family protein n=1 Tax=Heyndrickxia acidicola TaxID=209389 RepID=A0ABU6MP80_9BACI|nr:YppG family protein [Heyndrickxia acidicola]MED1205037.1 YppG family protein [Heyndrickxia acidicola]
MRGQNHTNNTQINHNGYSLRGEQTGYHRYPQPPYQPYQQPMPPNPYSHPSMQQPYQMMPGNQAGHGQFPYYQQTPDQGFNNQYMPPIFDNPLHPIADSNPSSGYVSQSANPYPKGNYSPRPPQGGFSNVMNSFKSQDGSLDFNKMMNTAGQMMNAVNQFSSMFKGLGGLFKT